MSPILTALEASFSLIELANELQEKALYPTAIHTTKAYGSLHITLSALCSLGCSGVTWSRGRHLAVQSGRHGAKGTGVVLQMLPGDHQCVLHNVFIV